MIKKKLFSYSIAVMLLIPFISLAKDDSNQLEKKVIKTYSVNASGKLNIENQFGEVVVNTWDKNEIHVEIIIKTNAKSMSKSEAILNGISISETVAGGSVYLKTNVSNNSSIKGVNQTMTIDYQVKMPSQNGLNIVNKFGNVYMGSFTGNLQLNVSYGNIKAEKLTGEEKKIKVSFGNATIEELETGDVESQYSKLNIEKISKVYVRNSFGKTYIREASNLKITQKYGDLEIGKVNAISGSVDFSNIEIRELGKSAELQLKYSGNADFGTLSSKVDLLKITASFSSIYMKFDETVNMDFDAHLKFGDLKANNKKFGDYMKNVDERNHTSDYKGKIGKGGNGNLILNTQYTNIHFH